MVRAPRGPSLASVAEALQLSNATVSNAYNRPDKLSAELRAQILAYAATVGYAGPNPVARQLSRGRTDTIGLVFSNELTYAFAHQAAVGFLDGLTSVCEGTEYNLLIIPTGATAGDRRVSKISSAAVDGIIVYSPPDGDVRLEAVLHRNEPVVVVEGPKMPKRAAWVGLDDREAGKTVANHLLGLGHRQFGLITFARGLRPSPGIIAPANVAGGEYRVPRERIVGVVDALSTAPGTQLTVFECSQGPSSREAGAAATTALLDVRPDITAIICLDDAFALGALDAARQRALNVPEQLSVTGFDDIPEAEWAGLTTIHQPLKRKGEIAASLVLDAKEHARRRHSVVVLPCELRVRRTTAKVRKRSR
ncbi:MAG: LacI family DNA-binding transcriptional regulator [Mycobacterium sp.]